MIVAIQGYAGSYSHAAAERVFGRGARILACERFADVFAALADGRADRIVVPIRNTVLGPIEVSRALVAGARLDAVAEVELSVQHCLIVRPDTRLAGVRRVASHPAALGQCRRFLESRPRWTAVAASDTAGAVRDLADGRLPAEAAIASARAARLYGCRILRRGVQDSADNVTTFTALRRRPTPVERQSSRSRSRSAASS